MKVLDVTYLKDYSIHVVFEDGIAGDVHLDDLIELGIFKMLKETVMFKKVYTTGYSIAWSEELEIDAATIYAELSGKAPGHVFSSPISYSAN
jgi:hypothetical protein